VKASLFPNSAALGLIALALDTFLVGQLCSRAQKQFVCDLLVTITARLLLSALKNTVTGGLRVQGFILFAGDFTARPSELNRRRVPEHFRPRRLLIWPVFGSC
jgi:hypothetical protein